MLFNRTDDYFAKFNIYEEIFCDAEMIFKICHDSLV